MAKRTPRTHFSINLGRRLCSPVVAVAQQDADVRLVHEHYEEGFADFVLTQEGCGDLIGVVTGRQSLYMGGFMAAAHKFARHESAKLGVGYTIRFEDMHQKLAGEAAGRAVAAGPAVAAGQMTAGATEVAGADAKLDVGMKVEYSVSNSSVKLSTANVRALNTGSSPASLIEIDQSTDIDTERVNIFPSV